MLKFLGTFLFAAFALAIGAFSAGAQTCPPFVDNNVLTAAQLNACFASSGTVRNLNFNAVSDLRSFVTPNSAATTLVANRYGYSTAGDGGAAIYVLSLTANCTDDGGGCIAPNSGPGRWLLVPQYPLNPMIWGKTNPVFLVDPSTGVDSFAGSGNLNYCIAVPCKTIGKAYDTCNQFLLTNDGFGEHVNIAAGTYNESVYANVPMVRYPNTNQVAAVGCTLTPTGAVTIAGDGVNACTICVTDPGVIIGLGNGSGTLTITGTRVANQGGLYVQIGGAAMVYPGVTFGATNGAPIILEDDGSQVQFFGSGDTVTGNSVCFISIADAGEVKFNGGVSQVINFSGNPAFSDATICGNGAGIVKINGGTTFTGSLSGGSKFDLRAGGKIYSQQSAGANVALPGVASTSVMNGNSTVYPESIVANATPSVSCSGLGSTGTATWNFGDSRGGIMTLTPGGSGITQTISCTLTLVSQPQISLNNSPLPVLSLFSWPAGSTYQLGSIIGTAVPFTVTAASALSGGSNYPVTYQILN